MPYEVPEIYIRRYAEVLVNFALGGGDGIKPGEVVRVSAPESARPLYAALCRAIWRAGGHVVADYRPDEDASVNLPRDFFELASAEQLGFFPGAYYRGLVEQVDHHVHVECRADPQALRAVDPTRLLTHQRSYAQLIRWQESKENDGCFTWTVGLYGTEGMAREARLSLEDYWAEIVRACFLDQPDPIRCWRRVSEEIRGFVDALRRLPVDRLHVRGRDVDLRLTLGQRRRWLGGGGRNIPSFEVFTSPDWRGTEGWIRFSEPLYVFGALISGIELEFCDGVVTRARAAENEELLRELLMTENANRVGEFSLTDARLSPITRFMATTLFDENVGGPYGNTHIALGRSLAHAYEGDPSALSPADWEQLGFNDSVVHIDVVSTTDREVTAVLDDGSERTIYAGGQFQLT